MAVFKFMGVPLFEYFEGILIEPLCDDDCDDVSTQYLNIKWLVDVPENVLQYQIIQVFFDGTFTLWDDEGYDAMNRMSFGAIESWRKASKLDYPPEYYAMMGD